jgi:D-methionine transport system ATP-binding protein
MNLSVRIAEAERSRIGSAPHVIDVKSLTKTYDPKAGAVLDDVSLRVGKGAIHGIIGRSGAGKSTLVRCLNGLVQPTSGQVFVAGREVSKLEGRNLRQARRDISSYLPEVLQLI